MGGCSPEITGERSGHLSPLLPQGGPIKGTPPSLPLDFSMPQLLCPLCDALEGGG